LLPLAIEYIQHSAISTHLHGQSVPMVGILLENLVCGFDGFLMLFGLVQLDKLPEGRRILAPERLGHYIRCGRGRTELREMEWAEVLVDPGDHRVRGKRM
jgi:hypothetical protein